jgi:hypothetical protein
MQGAIRLVTAVLLAIAFAHFSHLAAAQTTKQIKLTDKHIEGFVAAQGEIPAVTERIEDQTPEKLDPTLQAELEAIAKKHGFASYAEYDDVAATISMVMAGIDPQSKEFIEPKTAIQREIDEVEADASIPEGEKKQMLGELAEAMRTAPRIEYPSNIEIVKSYYDKIDAAMR